MRVAHCSQCSVDFDFVVCLVWFGGGFLFLECGD
jgi:hypothetical protein